MEKADEKNFKWHASFILYVFVVIAVIILALLPNLIGLYDNMTGAEGLKNITAALIFSGLPSILIFITAIISVIFSIKKIKLYKLFLIFAFIIFGGFLSYNSYFRIQFKENGLNRFTGGFPLLVSCIKDIANEEYKEFSVDVLSFGAEEFKSTSRSGAFYHTEYYVSGYTEGQPVFKAQLGKNDFERYSANNRYINVKVRIYKNSGFVSLIDNSDAELYVNNVKRSELFTIRKKDGRYIYSSNSDYVICSELKWLFFEEGKSDDPQNAVYVFDAAQTPEIFYHADTRYDLKEICLYAVIDGEYCRVSNVKQFNE